MCLLTTLTTPIYLTFLDTYILKKSQHNNMQQLKVKHIILHLNQEAGTDSDIKSLALNTPLSRLVHLLQFWLQCCCDLVNVEPAIDESSSTSLTSIKNFLKQKWFIN